MGTESKTPAWNSIKAKGLEAHINESRTDEYPYDFVDWRFFRDRAKLKIGALMAIFNKSRPIMEKWMEIDDLDRKGRPLV